MHASVSFFLSLSLAVYACVRVPVAEAMEKVGKAGVITVQDGKAMEDTLEITEGMRFDRGFISAYLVTDVKTQKAEFEDAFVLITEKKVRRRRDGMGVGDMEQAGR
jgi:chaperonin GroEL (HSP60 family)